MQRLITVLFCLIVMTAIADAQGPVRGVKDFLREFYDLSSLPTYASQSYSAEVSTYDRSGSNNDGFNGTYSFIRRNPDSSLVLFDARGPGVINRIWTPTPTDDSLDFYIDDSLKISFTICYRDLFSGKVHPFTAPLCANQLGGFYCYLPIPFNQSCKIVFRGKLTRFHQIGYRQYPAGTRLKKFSLPFDKEEEQALASIQSGWNHIPGSLFEEYAGPGSVLTAKKELHLQPGDKATVFETKQPGRITGFELLSADNLDMIAKDIDLKITWDDSAPAVYCPLADYFGYAFGKPSMRSLLVGSAGGKHYSYFPMPFDQSARIELIYRKPFDSGKGRPVNLASRVFYRQQKRNPLTEGKFYANWQRQNPVPAGQPFTMLDIKGQGHFVGTNLQAQGLNTGMTIFFEGDDSTVVDGELRMHGTGSEDFFNGGWYALLDCWDAAMSLPLSGALDYSIPFSRTGGYRLFITDKISFERSFFHSIEHGPEHNQVPADYTSVSYYYCSKQNIQQTIPAATNTKIYLQDSLTLYPQLLDIALEGPANIEPRWTFPTGGNSFYYRIGEDSRIRISLKDIPPGHYKVYLDYAKSPEGTSFAIWQRQTPLTGWINTFQDKITRVEMQEMTELIITELNNTVTLRFKPEGGKNLFILNRLILVKK